MTQPCLSSVLAASIALFGLASLSSAQLCQNQAGSCLVPHPTPACNDADCCNIVCGSDPLCCDISWDADCVLEAEASCVGLCGATVSGDCFVAHNNPACADETCCNTVCAIDPFCCDNHWDTTCAFYASLNCSGGGTFNCGDAGAGSCFVPHGNPACADAACCSAICKIDPSCCATNWDLICASLAAQFCVGFCIPPCPSNAIIESEGCGEDTNAICYAASAAPVLQSLPCGVPACGRVVLFTTPTSKPDVDVWSVTLADGDGDGLVGVRLVLSSSFNGFACLVPAIGCPPLATALAHVDSSLCVQALSELTCVPAGSYYLVVAAGDWPSLSNNAISCDSGNLYEVQVLCTDQGCGAACDANAGECYQFHKGVGCNDIACCEATCMIDPSCCTMQWDGVCVETAITLCAEAPPNDTCAGALSITEGATAISTIGAQSEGPPAPGCSEGGGDVAVRDVWFRYRPTRAAVVNFTTCGQALDFDSAIALYSLPLGGTCNSLVFQLCDDNAGSACLPAYASSVSLAVNCGSEYYVRVGGGWGTGTLTITQVTGGAACPPPCAADLDGSGSVGPSDLGILLGAWGAGGPADLDGSGGVNSSDLGILLGAWGPCP